MTLAKNDVSGERGEGYLLVPLAARKKNPSFWGWPGEYPKGATYHERAVHVIERPGIESDQRIYHQDTKSEFRLGTDLYFAGYDEGSLLEVIREPSAAVDFEYRIHAPGSPEYQELQKSAKTWAGSGNKRWGYQAD